MPNKGVSILLFAVSTLTAFAGDGSGFIDVGMRRELFVDDALVERISGNAVLRLHHPVPQNIAIVHDAPWEGSGSGYHSMFKDGDLYRMYYKSWQIDPLSEAGAKTKVKNDLFCAYAESDDGIHWRKPVLGLVEFNGSKANNIVMASAVVGKVDADAGHPAVFKDENPAAPADARYKAILRSREPRGLLAFKSPDGLHWSPLADAPIITDGAFDSQNLAFWDGARREYRAYWRIFTEGAGQGESWTPKGYRAIRTATSQDFIHWENQEDLRYVDSPPEHLYTNQIKPYFRAPHLLIGFPARYIERGHDAARAGASVPAGSPAADTRRISEWPPSLRSLPEREHREMRAAASERYGAAITDGLLMASRDGVLFKRWNEAFLPPGPERPGTWNYGHQYIGWHMLETKSALAGAPNEISLYAVESYWTDNSSALRRYTLRLDGFVSVQAPMAGGELVTRPIRFQGRQLALNFSTSGAGSVRVEIQDAAGRPLPGFALADCPPVFGDAIDRRVHWTAGPDVGALAGQVIRLRFVLNDADLYAYQFQE
jgi:hypothetical protein